MIRRLRKRLSQFQQQSPFTVTGRMLFVAFVASLTALVEDAIAPLLSYLFWILIGSFVCGLFYRPKLKIEFCPQGFGMPGNPLVLSFKVTNTGGLPAYDLRLALNGGSDGFQVADSVVQFSSLKAGETVRVELDAAATRRGAWSVPDIIATSYFPIGLFGFVSRHRHDKQQMIAPRMDRAAARLLLDESILGGTETLAAQQEQLAGVNQRSDEYEYVGSREFQPGLDARHWDYKATARLGVPIVREYTHYAQTAALMIVDNHVAKGSTQSSRTFESVLEVAATCIDTFRGQAKQLAIILGDNPEEYESYESQMLALARASGTPHPTDYRKLLGGMGAAESLRIDVVLGIKKQVLVVVNEDDVAAIETLDELNNLGEFEICPVLVPLSWQKDTAQGVESFAGSNVLNRKHESREANA
ncbi:MAG: DUF58 domain-containing protein [Aureliella sp.]